MPRLTVRPAFRPSSTFGRIPAATTTRSASSFDPSESSTPVTVSPPSIALVLPPSSTFTPSSSIFDRRYAPPQGSSCRSISVSIRCTTVTWQPLHLEPASRLEAEKAAANDDRACLRSGALQQRSRVVERAEREHPVLVEPRDRREPGRAAHRQQQRVIRRDASVVAGDRLGPRIDIDNPHADAEVDAVLPIPFEPVDHDVVSVFFAGEHRREQHAVVVDVGLFAEDRDIEARQVLQDVLEARHAGHAVADDHQRLHRAVLSTRTADCL